RQDGADGDLQGHRSRASRGSWGPGYTPDGWVWDTRKLWSTNYRPRPLAERPGGLPDEPRVLPEREGHRDPRLGHPGEDASRRDAVDGEGHDRRRASVHPEHLAGERVLDAGDRVGRAEDHLGAGGHGRRAAHDHGA